MQLNHSDAVPGGQQKDTPGAEHGRHSAQRIVRGWDRFGAGAGWRNGGWADWYMQWRCGCIKLSDLGEKTHICGRDGTKKMWGNKHARQH